MHRDGEGSWDPLGVTPDGAGGANVALWAQGADRVELCVFVDGVETRIELTSRLHNIFYAHIDELPAGTLYGFRVHGPWDPETGQRWNPAKLLQDPYARAIDGQLLLNPAIFGHKGADDLVIDAHDSAPFVPRSVVVSDNFDWQGDRPLERSWSDTVIYETHVRGITMNHPGVPEHLRGTYAGLATAPVIEHLKALGVSAVELLPLHHFVDEVHLLECGLTNYWGYNSLGFFAPHARYSSTGSRGGQVSEFKEMVRTLHGEGLEVILDVVYNHTAEGNQFGPTLSFRGITNDGYYKLAESGRYHVDYTGCGNTLDLSHPHVLQMVLDSLRYWVNEMHVDGFRFDLASALIRSTEDVDMLSSFLTAISQDPVLRRTKLIAEPWDLGPGGYQVGEFPFLWTEWNDRYRDSVRDFWRGTPGLRELGWRMSGSADLYESDGKRPYSSINFITAHDGFTMRDLVSFERKHNEANLEANRDGTDNNRSRNYGHEGETDNEEINAIRRRQIRNMLTTLALSAGVPMINGGDEFGRTQQGNNNAYCQDNSLAWFGWDWEQWQCDLNSYAQSVFALRRENQVFRQTHFSRGESLVDGGPEDLAWFDRGGQMMEEDSWNEPSAQTLMMFLAPHQVADPSARSFLLIAHGGGDDIEVTLPGEPYATDWEVCVDSFDGAVWPGVEHAAGSKIPMRAYSTLVLRAGT
ncbi:MAG: glycogen debranching protein GlgX [Candidatus Nanopelagicales bacterium]|nr:glycogen debranching protein GlgX [Candidatus Nanopelagicales bacterium]